MYTIEPDANGVADRRLVAASKLDATDFAEIARKLGQTPQPSRKRGLVAARPSAGGERIETLWNGAETSNVAAAGDWVVTTLDADGVPLLDDFGNPNVYVIAAARFTELYAPASGGAAAAGQFRAKGVVEALYFPGGFEIVAPWGEVQRADAGYLLANGGEVYGNHRDTFAATYVRVDPGGSGG